MLCCAVFVILKELDHHLISKVFLKPSLFSNCLSTVLSSDVARMRALRVSSKQKIKMAKGIAVGEEEGLTLALSAK